MNNTLMARICKSPEIDETGELQLKYYLDEISKKCENDDEYRVMLVNPSLQLLMEYAKQRGKDVLTDYFTRESMKSLGSTQKKIIYALGNLTQEEIGNIANQEFTSLINSDNSRTEFEKALNSDSRDLVLEECVKRLNKSIDEISSLPFEELWNQYVNSYKFSELSDSELATVGMKLPEGELKEALGEMYEDFHDYKEGTMGWTMENIFNSDERRNKRLIERYGSESVKEALKTHYAKKRMLKMPEDELSSLIEPKVRQGTEQSMKKMEEAYLEQNRLTWLARAESHKVRLEIAQFEYAPEDALIYLAQHADIEEKKALRTEETDSRGIKDARRSDSKIKLAVARNERTPSLALYDLTRFEIDTVLRGEETLRIIESANRFNGTKKRVEMLEEQLNRTDNWEERKVLGEQLEEAKEEQRNSDTDLSDAKSRLRINYMESDVLEAIVSNPNTPMCSRFDILEGKNGINPDIYDLSELHVKLMDTIKEEKKVKETIKRRYRYGAEELEWKMLKENHVKNRSKSNEQKMQLAHTEGLLEEGSKFIELSRVDLLRKVLYTSVLDRGEAGIDLSEKLIKLMRAIRKGEQVECEPFSEPDFLLTEFGYVIQRDKEEQNVENNNNRETEEVGREDGR
ncbi:MAG: hypothetical protein IKG14_00245 [Clostridia bacterium]|nr:hypothetical protein [Clostridia bacterium]